jgi:hypothetical protein
MRQINKYSVVRAVWSYASMASSSVVAAIEIQGGPRRLCAVQSEEEWWDGWRTALAQGISERRTDWVTEDDL